VEYAFVTCNSWSKTRRSTPPQGAGVSLTLPTENGRVPASASLPELRLRRSSRSTTDRFRIELPNSDRLPDHGPARTPFSRSAIFRALRRPTGYCYPRSPVKQNKYDEPEFFAEYSRMPRSIHGLAAARSGPPSALFCLISAINGYSIWVAVSVGIAVTYTSMELPKLSGSIYPRKCSNGLE